MTACWLIAVAAVVSLATGPTQLLMFKPIRRNGGASIVAFERAGSWKNARAIMAAWGEQGQTAMRRTLWLDFVFIAGYGTLGATIAHVTAGHADYRGWPIYAHVATGAMIAFIVAAALDAIENVALFAVLRNSGHGPTPTIANNAARAKFTLLGAAVVVTAAIAVLFLAATH